MRGLVMDLRSRTDGCRNLPGCLKMSRPGYIGLPATEVPQIQVAAGTRMLRAAGVTGPVNALTDRVLSVVTVDKGSEVDLPAPAGRQILCHAMRGSVMVDGTEAPRGHSSPSTTKATSASRHCGMLRCSMTMPHRSGSRSRSLRHEHCRRARVHLPGFSTGPDRQADRREPG